MTTQENNSTTQESETDIAIEPEDNDINEKQEESPSTEETIPDKESTNSEEPILHTDAIMIEEVKPKKRRSLIPVFLLLSVGCILVFQNNLQSLALQTIAQVEVSFNTLVKEYFITSTSADEKEIVDADAVIIEPLDEIEEIADTTLEPLPEPEIVIEEVALIGAESYASTIAVPSPEKFSSEETLLTISAYGEEEDLFLEILENVADYPEEILLGLANNPEMISFAYHYPTRILDSEYTSPTVVLSEEEMNDDCPLFLQWDERWGYAPYGETNIAISGCGPTALAMVIQGLTDDDTVTPLTVANFAMENDYYMYGTGTMWNLMLEGATSFGLYSYSIKNNVELMKECLDNGNYLICSVGQGYFTYQGHFIVIYGYDSTGFMINDPYCYERSQKTWTFEEITSQIKSTWTLSAN